MKKLWVLFVLCTLSCAGLSALDKSTLQDAASLNLAAYRGLDGGAARALTRGAFCATTSVLVRNDAGAPDAGKDLQCQP